MAPRIGVIGCGQWGQNHVRTLAEIGVLAAVSDADAERAALLSARFQVPALSLDAILSSAEIDALVLALPATAHGPVARRAFAAGKDVLIEKPISLDAADAAETAAASAAEGRILMVGHLLRFHPTFRALAALVREGRIGRLRHVVSNRQGLGRFLGMDAVWDLAPHDVSMVLHLCGEAPTAIRSIRQTVLSNATDVADIALEFPSGVSAGIHVSRVSPYRDRRLSAIGTEGMLTFDDLAPEGQRLAFYGHQVRSEDGRYVFATVEPDHLDVSPALPLPLEAELRHFIACIETRSAPETGAAEAVESVRILAAASPL